MEIIGVVGKNCRCPRLVCRLSAGRCGVSVGFWACEESLDAVPYAPQPAAAGEAAVEPFVSQLQQFVKPLAVDASDAAVFVDEFVKCHVGRQRHRTVLGSGAAEFCAVDVHESEAVVAVPGAPPQHVPDVVVHVDDARLVHPGGECGEVTEEGAPLTLVQIVDLRQVGQGGVLGDVVACVEETAPMDFGIRHRPCRVDAFGKVAVGVEVGPFRLRRAEAGVGEAVDERRAFEPLDHPLFITVPDEIDDVALVAERSHGFRPPLHDGGHEVLAAGMVAVDDYLCPHCRVGLFSLCKFSDGGDNMKAPASTFSPCCLDGLPPGWPWHTVFPPLPCNDFGVTIRCFCHYHTMILYLAYYAVGVCVPCKAAVVLGRHCHVFIIFARQTD